MTKNLERKKCPKFEGECTSNKKICNTDLLGQNTVIYFYPKDSTPGCTTEGQDFRAVSYTHLTLPTILLV